MTSPFLDAPTIPFFISIPEAANILGCSINSVRRLIDTGTLTTIRLGTRGVRIPKTTLEAYLQKSAERGKF